MQVDVLEVAKKEAVALSAQSSLQQAIDILKTHPWDQLKQQGEVVAFQGKPLKGAYEIKVSRYRGILFLLHNQSVLIFAFFKKEGRILKRTELLRIEKRLKRLHQQLL